MRVNVLNAILMMSVSVFGTIMMDLDQLLALLWGAGIGTIFQNITFLRVFESEE